MSRMRLILGRENRSACSIPYPSERLKWFLPMAVLDGLFGG